MLTYCEIYEKANANDLTRLLRTAEDLLVEEEKNFLQANGESTRKAKSLAKERLTEWVNRALEEKDKLPLTPEDFKHFRLSYICTKAFASLLEV